MELKTSFTVCTRVRICLCHETDENNQQDPVQSFYNPLQCQSPIYNLIFQVVSFPQVSPPQPYMHLSSLSYKCHVPHPTCYYSRLSPYTIGRGVRIMQHIINPYRTNVENRVSS